MRNRPAAIRSGVSVRFGVMIVRANTAEIAMCVMRHHRAEGMPRSEIVPRRVEVLRVIVIGKASQRVVCV